MVAKSCTTLDGWTPITNGINHLSTGAGFHNHPPYQTWFAGACWYMRAQFNLSLSPLMLDMAMLGCYSSTKISSMTISTIMLLIYFIYIYNSSHKSSMLLIYKKSVELSWSMTPQTPCLCPCHSLPLSSPVLPGRWDVLALRSDDFPWSGDIEVSMVPPVIHRSLGKPRFLWPGHCCFHTGKTGPSFLGWQRFTKDEWKIYIFRMVNSSWSHQQVSSQDWPWDLSPFHWGRRPTKTVLPGKRWSIPKGMWFLPWKEIPDVEKYTRYNHPLKKSDIGRKLPKKWIKMTGSSCGWLVDAKKKSCAFERFDIFQWVSAQCVAPVFVQEPSLRFIHFSWHVWLAAGHTMGLNIYLQGKKRLYMGLKGGYQWVLQCDWIWLNSDFTPTKRGVYSWNGALASWYSVCLNLGPPCAPMAFHPTPELVKAQSCCRKKSFRAPSARTAIISTLYSRPQWGSTGVLMDFF